MKRVILCPNPYRDGELTVAKHSKEILEAIGFETVVCLPFSREGYDDQLGVPIRQLQQEIKRADMLIAFGGDGTILHLARTVALHGVPVLGINLGSLGFMSELEPNELERLNALKEWNFAVESRMMLDVTVLREGKPVYSNIALNDAVISKGSVARVVRLDVSTEEGRLTRITGDPKYLKFMNAEFYATTSKLYDTEERLFYRDASFMDMREPNGRKVFWSRGNGWVYAGLAILLETVPESDPSYDFYRRLFLEMTDALLACQDENGSWRPSLLDPEVYPTPENSGSAFFTYGLAWGVNHGILKGKVYRKAAKRSWKTLCSYVREDGRMEYVQPVGARPRITKPDQTEGYGVGAFLLAASEIVKM